MLPIGYISSPFPLPHFYAYDLNSTSQVWWRGTSKAMDSLRACRSPRTQWNELPICTELFKGLLGIWVYSRLCSMVQQQHPDPGVVVRHSLCILRRKYHRAAPNSSSSQCIRQATRWGGPNPRPTARGRKRRNCENQAVSSPSPAATPGRPRRATRIRSHRSLAGELAPPFLAAADGAPAHRNGPSGGTRTLSVYIWEPRVRGWERAVPAPLLDPRLARLRAPGHGLPPLPSRRCVRS